MAGYGFIPIGGIDGRPYNGATVRCVVLGGDTTDIHVNDMVKQNGTGSTAGVISVTKVAAGEVIFGSVVSIEPRHAADNMWIDGSEETADRYVNVAPATDGMLYMCNPASAIAVTDIGGLADLTVGAGAAPFWRSTSTLTASFGTSTAQLQLLGMVQNGKLATAADADLIVRVVETQLGHATDSVGV
jgi:hypothetical protein